MKLMVRIEHDDPVTGMTNFQYKPIKGWDGGESDPLEFWNTAREMLAWFRRSPSLKGCQILGIKVVEIVGRFPADDKIHEEFDLGALLQVVEV